ncbi:DUF3717 domain-containing protein [Chitinasiproducens palmae]|uniref:DUF3717 domain-containing protein n=1 Tax=Chitinasiproducens palmae TaxID=1770053 RepID=A0A1H2PR41_9BURK|nr:DUF3717 domain-containing protein [Chitinasiproducens palmae]SDV48507.1 Protein of unknown function [Chitinasiproducens palmae]
MPTITITDIEAAINFWRQRSPSVGDEMRLCAPAGDLARCYALMIVNGWEAVSADQLEPAAHQAWQGYLSATQGKSKDGPAAG